MNMSIVIDMEEWRDIHQAAVQCQEVAVLARWLLGIMAALCNLRWHQAGTPQEERTVRTVHLVPMA
jgi:hypothetical protein